MTMGSSKAASNTIKPMNAQNRNPLWQGFSRSNRSAPCFPDMHTPLLIGLAHAEELIIIALHTTNTAGDDVFVQAWNT